MKTNIKHQRNIFFAIVICMIFMALFLMPEYLFVSEAETTQSLTDKSEEFTETDSFTFQDNVYTLTDYRNSIKDMVRIEQSDKTLFSFNATYYSIQYFNGCRVYGDDPITKIIPKEYFTFVNTTTFIGKEYGFFINTEIESYSMGYSSYTTNNLRSQVLIFDINNNTDLVSNMDRAIITVSNLMQLEFVTVSSDSSSFWRKLTGPEYDRSINITNNSNLDYAVVPLFGMNSSAEINKYYLTDISFAGTLQNEQNENVTDDNYDPYNDIGSFFTRVDYIYDAIQVVDGEIDEDGLTSIAATFFEEGASAFIGCLPFIGDLFSIQSMVVSVTESIFNAVSEKRFDSTNDTYIMNANYTNRDDQIQYNGYIAKNAGIAINSDSNLKLLFGKGDSARAEYTISHSALNGQQPEYTRFNSEIALKVVDENFNECSIATTSQKLFLREKVYKTVSPNQFINYFLLENGANYFSFTPEYTGYYVFNDVPKIFYYNQDLRLLIDGYVLTYENIDSTSIKLNQNQQYDIVLENPSEERIISSFVIRVDEHKIGITLSPDEGFITAINEDMGIQKITFSNENAQLSVYNSAMSEIINSENNSFYVPITYGTHYAVIKNDTNNAISGNLSLFNDFAVLSTSNDTTINILEEGAFFKFTPSEDATYSFAKFNNSDAVYNTVLYSNVGISVQPTTYFGNTYTRYDYNLPCEDEFGETITYYFGYFEASETDGNMTLSIGLKTNAYQFYIDNTLVTGSIILTQNQEFDLTVKLNNQELSDVEYIVGNANYIDKKPNGKYYILPNAPISWANPCNISIIDKDSNSLSFISVKVVPGFTIDFETYSTTEAVPNKIKWIFSSTSNNYSISLKLDLVFSYLVRGNQGGWVTETYTINNISGSGVGYIDFPSINRSDIYFCTAKAEVKNLVFTQTLEYQSTTEIYTMNFHNTYFENSFESGSQSFFKEPVTVNRYFAGGEGHGNSPYLIKNAWQLNNMRNMVVSARDEFSEEQWIEGTYMLVEDITLDTFQTLPYFTGTFSGSSITNDNNNNKTITINNLTAYGEYAGLFSFLISGQIYNINVNIQFENTTATYKGAICGVASTVISGGESRIENCNVSGNFTKQANNSKDSIIGGVVGSLPSGKVLNCNSSVNISTYGDAGGIACHMGAGLISSCSYSGRINVYYTTGSIDDDSENKCIGGLVGKVSAGRIIGNKVINAEIYYMSAKCNDVSLKPRISLIVGIFIKTSASSIIQDTQDVSGTVYVGSLYNDKEFNQLQYVKQDDSLWGEEIKL